MSQQLYKAVIHYDAEIVPVCTATGYLLEHPHLDANRDIAAQIISRALAWLRDARRAAHYVNAYDNTDHARGDGRIVVVLSDRTTAIMLKLALG